MHAILPFFVVRQSAERSGMEPLSFGRSSFMPGRMLEPRCCNVGACKPQRLDRLALTQTHRARVDDYGANAMTKCQFPGERAGTACDIQDLAQRMLAGNIFVGAFLLSLFL